MNNWGDKNTVWRIVWGMYALGIITRDEVDEIRRRMYETG